VLCRSLISVKDERSGAPAFGRFTPLFFWDLQPYSYLIDPSTQLHSAHISTHKSHDSTSKNQTPPEEDAEEEEGTNFEPTGFCVKRPARFYISMS
jgi:hypothetical protein